MLRMKRTIEPHKETHLSVLSAGGCGKQNWCRWRDSNSQRSRSSCFTDRRPLPTGHHRQWRKVEESNPTGSSPVHGFRDRSPTNVAVPSVLAETLGLEPRLPALHREDGLANRCDAITPRLRKLMVRAARLELAIGFTLPVSKTGALPFCYTRILSKNASGPAGRI